MSTALKSALAASCHWCPGFMVILNFENFSALKELEIRSAILQGVGWRTESDGTEFSVPDSGDASGFPAR